MEINIRNRWVIIVACALVSGIIGILIWQFDYSEQKTSQSITKQAIQTAQQSKHLRTKNQLLSGHKLNNEPASNQLVSHYVIIQEEKGKKSEKADISLIGENLQEMAESKETPAELLQRYLKVTNSSEFREEFDSVVTPFDTRIEQTYLPKINKLEDKKTELEQKLETDPKIQSELERVKSDLWETEVKYAEEIILMADAIHKVFLRHFTNEEIRIAREEMQRTMPMPNGLYIDGETREKNAMIRSEAMERLKAIGWMPSNPDERWY